MESLARIVALIRDPSPLMIVRKRCTLLGGAGRPPPPRVGVDPMLPSPWGRGRPPPSAVRPCLSSMAWSSPQLPPPPTFYFPAAFGRLGFQRPPRRPPVARPRGRCRHAASRPPPSRGLAAAAVARPRGRRRRAASRPLPSRGPAAAALPPPGALGAASPAPRIPPLSAPGPPFRPFPEIRGPSFAPRRIASPPNGQGVDVARGLRAACVLLRPGRVAGTYFDACMWLRRRRPGRTADAADADDADDGSPGGTRRAARRHRPTR